ncbi:C3a anaphylatoxin chemotactic receptor [Struthio camelus]|uniref:C3a anaphylatoxin chemotactic receptor n=1 Tax=Struthio camelus TaxID=8801 RepID=UPI00051E2570|nr:PREDICTED: C3a anaphylatoxin chemotactic receptor [Struthio camelus australis]
MSPHLGNSSSHEQAAVRYASESIGSLAVFIFVFIIGIPGNGLVIWVAGLKMKRSVNVVWFLNLAVADFMCCLSLPFFIVHLVLHEHWPYGWFLCKVIPSVIIFTMFASVFLLMAISIDRCLLVRKPVWCQNHRTVKFVSLMCSGIWILAFIFCCPVFHYRETITYDGKTECGYNFKDDKMLDYMDDDDLVNESLEEYSPLIPTGTYDRTIFTHQPVDDYPDFQTESISTNKDIITTSQILYSTVPVDINLLLTSTAYPDIKLFKSPSGLPSADLSAPSNTDLHLKLPDFPDGLLDFDNVYSANDSLGNFYEDYSVPLPLMVITITRTVFGFLLPFSIMAVCYALIAFRMLAKQFHKQHSKMLRVILLVVAAFFVCWAPYHVVGILSFVATPGTGLRESLILWDHLSTALAYVNSCINPLLYVFVGRDFRAKARQSVQGILEGAFVEELTHSTPYSLDRSKMSTDKDVSIV